MAISGVNPKCYILALFVRDDGARFLLGDDPFEFKDNQLHFQQNTMANDVVEVQGNDGYLLAGQVRRPGTQVFDGYVCNGTNSKEEVEVKRRAFLQFFRRSHFYKVIYVFPNGTAIQRKQGFLVDDPTVQELYQQYPEYHVALNFEDVNYYTYEEDDQGQEIYAKEAIVSLAGGGATGGLIWDSYGVVWEDPWSLPLSISGVQFQILNNAGARAPIDNVELYGDTYQQTYSGKNLIDPTNLSFVYSNSPTQIGLSSISNGIRMVNNGGTSQDRFAVFRSVDLTPYIGKVVRMKATFGASGGIRLYRIASDGSNRSQMATTTVSNTEISFTVPADLGSSPYLGYVLDVTVGGGTSVDFTNLIATVDSSIEPYEPYVGGIPSPNPDYPQAVQTVTGEQNVLVYGKNLFDPNGTSGVYRATKEVTGNTIKVTATANGTGYLAIVIPNSDNLLNKTYTVSYSAQSSVGVARLRLFTGTSSNPSSIGTSIKTVDGNGEMSSSVTFPSAYDAGRDCFVILLYPHSDAITTSIGDYATYSNIQLELGSATSYEPYQSQSYPISLTGKNLFNVSATPTYTNGVSVSGNLTITATSSGTNKYALYRLVEAKNYVGSKVWVSCSGMYPSSTNDARIEIGLCNADGTSKTSKAYTNNVNIKPSFTVTDDPSKPYIYVALYASYSSSASVGAYVGYGNVMVNRGSTPGTYASYSPIELCKIGTYRDKIFNNDPNEDWYDPDLEDNAWYVHKEFGKYVFNGSETIAYNSSNKGFTINPTNLPNYMPNHATPPMVGLSTHFEVNSTTSTWTGDNRIGLSSSGTFWCKATSFATSQSDCLTWLAANTPSVYYALATPTDTKITEATLVGQLEALDATRLFIGENNVLVSTPEPNLPATLSFDYYTKFAAMGAEWEEGGTKGATIVNVDAIDNTYPVWELTGPATNPTLSVLTTNTTLTYNGTITASQKLVIDMFNKTATLNGTSVIGNISGDFVYMAPGTNRVAYTAGNTDAPDSTIYWQEVVG